MSPDVVRRALLARGIKPTTTKLLVYMADRADASAMFYQGRERTSHDLGIPSDTIKRALRELIALGYVREDKPAVAGKYPRRLELLPATWPQPEQWRRPERDPPPAPLRVADLHPAPAPELPSSTPADPMPDAMRGTTAAAARARARAGIRAARSG